MIEENYDTDLNEQYAEIENILALDSEELEQETVDYIKMDYSLETAEERNELVKKIIDSTPPKKLTPRYLEKLADYIVLALDKKEKQEKRLLTDNHMVTVNRRETSFEGLVGKLENGEDGIYNMIANDKNIIFSPKVSITEQDVAEIPELGPLREAIAQVRKAAASATGRRAFLLRKQLIEMCQDQYVIKNAYKKPIYCTNLIKSFAKIDLSEEVNLDENNNVYSTGLVNLYNEKHISALLCNYCKLKEDTWSSFTSDAKWLMMDLDAVVDLALKEKHPMYYDLVIYKIDGKQNLEIQELLYAEYGIKHSVEYISSLWRNKIPKLIAEAAQNDWLLWHFTNEEKGKWKRCSRCGQIKLAHNRFFSKNKTSKDGFYSICKECRNAKK